jgi:hypothetical protein
MDKVMRILYAFFIIKEIYVPMFVWLVYPAVSLCPFSLFRWKYSCAGQKEMDESVNTWITRLGNTLN